MNVIHHGRVYSRVVVGGGSLRMHAELLHRQARLARLAPPRKAHTVCLDNCQQAIPRNRYDT